MQDKLFVDAVINLAKQYNFSQVETAYQLKMLAAVIEAVLLEELLNSQPGENDERSL